MNYISISIISIVGIIADFIEPCSGFDGYIMKCEEPDWAGSNMCMVLVNTNGGTCNNYCEDQGSVCVKGVDNADNGCSRSNIEGCGMSYYDQICVCTVLNQGN